MQHLGIRNYTCIPLILRLSVARFLLSDLFDDLTSYNPWYFKSQCFIYYHTECLKSQSLITTRYTTDDYVAASLRCNARPNELVAKQIFSSRLRIIFPRENCRFENLQTCFSFKNINLWCLAPSLKTSILHYITAN